MKLTEIHNDLTSIETLMYEVDPQHSRMLSIKRQHAVDAFGNKTDTFVYVLTFSSIHSDVNGVGHGTTIEEALKDLRANLSKPAEAT